MSKLFRQFLNSKLSHQAGRKQLHSRALLESLESRILLSGTNPNEIVDTSLTPTQLAQSLVGAGVSVSNVTFTGGSQSTGSFNFTSPTVVGFSQGILLTSGNAVDVVGPNVSDWTSTDWTLPGDADLTALSGYQTFDAAVLEFDFVPTANQVVFEYAFASDEYPEWVNTVFNDVFAFYVNGTNHAVVRQIAGDPAAPFVPVAVNNINNGNPEWYPDFIPMRTDLFRPNYWDPNGGPSVIDLEADGITTVLTFQAPVNPGVINHIKLAIADTSDGIYDSTVFIKAGSLVSNSNPVADLSVSPESGSAPLNVTAFIEGEDPNGSPLIYVINWGDGTPDSTGNLNQPTNESEKTAQVNHTYNSVGNYTAALTISNGTLVGTSKEDVQVGLVQHAKPVVTSQPADKNVVAGSLFTLSAAASGSPKPTVQWQISTDSGATFVNIPGATFTSYSATASLTDDGNQYRAVFTNSEGSATTTAALLSVSAGDLAPVVTEDPTDQIVSPGDLFSFSASATGVPAPTVQWQVLTIDGTDFVDIPGATDTTYSGTASLSDDGSQYRAVFTNSDGSVATDSATLTVTQVDVPPVVTSDPTDQTVFEGDLFSFSASATGVPDPTVQWQVLTIGSTGFADIPGATDTTYSAVASRDENGSQYRAVFTSDVDDDGDDDSVYTDIATLTVLPMDSTPPVAPGVTLTQDTGSSSVDKITSVGTVNLSGIEADASVQFSIDDGAHWTAGFSAVENLNSVLVRQTDLAGNIGDAASFSFILDTTVLAPGIALNQDTGSSSTDKITKVGTLKLSDIEADAIVQFSIDNGASWTGGFSAVENLNSVLVRQTDLAGNVSAATPFSFTLDTTPPGMNPSFSSTQPFLVNAEITALPNATDAWGIAWQYGGAVDTSSAGHKNYTCTAADLAGNSASVQSAYVVTYAIVIVKPLEGETFRNTKQIPVSFQLFDANGLISDQTAASLLPAISVAFDGQPPESVKYKKASKTFSASLKTNKPLAGTYDVTIRLTLNGADVITETITFKEI